MAVLIQDMVGFQGNLVFNPSYPDGQPKRRLDTTRAQERFGWIAQVKLEQGLRETITWMQTILG